MPDSKVLVPTRVLVEYLKKKDGPVKAADIAKDLNVSVRSINRGLGWLEESGQIKTTRKYRRVLTEAGIVTKPIFGSYTYAIKNK